MIYTEKYVSVEGKDTDSPVKKKVLGSIKNVMPIVFWDMKNLATIVKGD